MTAAMLPEGRPREAVPAVLAVPAVPAVSAEGPLAAGAMLRGGRS
jgi:hypothetical protein